MTRVIEQILQLIQFFFFFPACNECDWDLCRGAGIGAADSGRNTAFGKHQLQRSWQLCRGGERGV